MSALKEFANFINYNVASLAATYDRLMADDEAYQTLQADSRMAWARRLIKAVAEACETGAPEPLLSLVEKQRAEAALSPEGLKPSQLFLEIEYLGQTLTPVVTNLEAGKFLWQTLAEVRTAILPAVESAMPSPADSPAQAGPGPESKHMVEQLRKLSAAVEQSANSIMITNRQGYIEYVNPKFVELTGYTLAEATGQHTRLLKSGETSQAEYRELWQTITAGKVWHGEFHNKKKNGELYWESASISPIKNAEGEITHFLAVKEDITARKQMEETLKEAEARYRTLLQNIPIGLYRNTPGPPGKFLMANPAIAQIFGYDSVDEFMQVNVTDLYVDPAERQVFAENLLAQGQVTRAEVQLKRRDGSLLWGAITARVIYDDAGEVAYFDGMIEDITERKQAEAAVRESQQMLQLVMDNVPQSVFWKDKNLVYLGCNRRFAADAGLNSPEEIIGKRDAELVWREQAELYNEDDRRVMGSNQPKLNFEEPQTTPSGEKIWLQTSKVPLHDNEGNVIGIMGMYGDITARKRVEEALQHARDELELRVEERTIELARERNLLRAVMDNLPDNMYVKDRQGRILLANQATTHHVGLTLEEMIGKTDFDFFSPEEAAQYFAEEQALMESGQPQIEKEFALFDQEAGTTKWFAITKVPFRDTQGQVVGMVGLNRDITVIKEAQLKVEQLLSEAQRRAHREQTIREITEKMRAASSLEQLVKVTAQELGARLEAGHAVIELGLEPSSQ